MSLKRKTGRFDLLVNNYMFDLIAFDDIDAILEEFKRVLKNGGKLILVNMTEGRILWLRNLQSDLPDFTQIIRRLPQCAIIRQIGATRL